MSERTKSDNPLHHNMRRSEMRMTQQAIRNKWNIPPETMELQVEKVTEAIKSTTRGKPDNTALRAMELVKDMNAQNIQVDQQIDKDARTDSGKASGVTDIRVTYEATPGARSDDD